MVAKNYSSYPWHQELNGVRLLAAEKKELADYLSKLFGYHIVFVGDPALAPLIESSLITHRVILSPQPIGKVNSFEPLHAEVEALPLHADSVDVVVLAHTLEHSINPHEVLRETHRVLIPEGHVIITGFNPLSCWGGWHAYKQCTGKMPKSGKMLAANRIKDWLSLLNFQIVGGRSFYFRPPTTHEKIHQQLAWLENWGHRWWPFLGGAYTLVAVKRVVPLTPIRAKYRFEKRLWGSTSEGLPKPTTTAIDK